MAARAEVIHLRAGEAGMMLVELLASRRRGGDWGEANRLVRERRVQVNGNLATDPARLLKVGDVVKVLPHAISGPARTADVRLVHVDEHLVVVDKPPGVTTLREGGAGAGRRNRQLTLDEMVARMLAQRPAGTKSPGGPGRAGGARARPAPRPEARREDVYPVHRLDRDTSGLMLFARTRTAERVLAGMFKGRQIERAYLAVVHGHPEAMTITTHLVRDRGDGLRGSAELWGQDPGAGQRAVTHLEPLEAVGPYEVIRCVLETGRTHQIRIHLSEIGHMLCGEKQYVRRPDGSRHRDASGAPRHALHAERLAFDHPLLGRPMSFQSPLPQDMAEWLRRLRRR